MSNCDKVIVRKIITYPYESYRNNCCDTSIRWDRVIHIDEDGFAYDKNGKKLANVEVTKAGVNIKEICH